jgi:hypothetical protein
MPSLATGLCTAIRGKDSIREEKVQVIQPMSPALDIIKSYCCGDSSGKE